MTASDRRFSEDPVGAMGFIDLQWLVDHHEAKVHYRREMVDALSLRPGDTVLDVGCGPGLWSELLAEKVWPTGRVVGLDLSAELIRYARQWKDESRYGDVMEFQEGSFYDLPFSDDSFSRIFFGNCLAYCADPGRVLFEQKRVAQVGGKIAVKDFDGGFVLFHPVDHELSCRVLEATARRLREDPANPPFDNYAGRKLTALMKRAQLSDVSTTSYAIQMIPPLTEAAKRYIKGNAQWYGEMAKPFLSRDNADAWSEYFDQKWDKYILDRDDVYFCMLEVLCTGTIG
jgi:SAM-dependent methyltransferase